MREPALDQALGLRRLFAERAVRVLPVVAGDGERPGRAALGLARALNALGHRCLIIDATRGDLARRLGLAVRYELRHVGLGDRRLDDVVLQADAQLRVLPATRGLAELAAERAPAEGLARLAEALGHREDWILIAADAPYAALAAAFAGRGEVGIACRLDACGRTAAYAVMKRIVQATRAQRFRLLAEGTGGPHASAELDQVVRRFLGARVASGADDPRSWACALLHR